MSSDPTGRQAQPGGRGGDVSDQPSEEELRAAYEAELSRITSADMMLQAAVSLLNIGGHRLGVARAPTGEGGGPTGGPDSHARPERDLEQVRDAIDAVRALLEILERRLPAELGPLRDALSQLQIAYAREVKTSAAGAAPGASATKASEPDARAADAGADRKDRAEPSGQDPAPEDGKRPGPAEASGRLWVPGR